MKWRENFQKWKARFFSYHPLLQALFFMAATVAILVFVPMLLGLDYSSDQDVVDWVRADDFGEVFYIFVIEASIKEELIYHGPAYVILLLCLFCSYLLGRPGDRLNIFRYKIFWDVTLTDVMVWLFAIVPTIFWASLHPYPLPTFGGGIVFAWLMIRTRNILYAILLHAICNTIALMSMILGLSPF